GLIYESGALGKPVPRKAQPELAATDTGVREVMPKMKGKLGFDLQDVIPDVSPKDSGSALPRTEPADITRRPPPATPVVVAKAEPATTATPPAAAAPAPPPATAPAEPPPEPAAPQAEAPGPPPIAPAPPASLRPP